MKNMLQLFLAVLPWLLLLFLNKGFCVNRVDCQWGPFGEWSECDACTKLQTRSRSIAVYSQFGGNPCDGDRIETRSCKTTKACPLEDGCGDRFRCRSGKCVSRSLVCNGEPDCEGDFLDERNCELLKYITCFISDVPPKSDLLGLGFNAVTGKWSGSVINTNSFGGRCHVIFSERTSSSYRLPFNTVKFSYKDTVQNDFSDEVYISKWHYATDLLNKEGAAYHNHDIPQTEDRTPTQRLLVLKSDIELAQFQSHSPQYILITEEFWRAVAKLPSVYEYAAYKKVLEMFGTHYMSEGSLGGSFRVIASFDAETVKQKTTETQQYDKCERSKNLALIFRIISLNCKSGPAQHTVSSIDETTNEVNKVDVIGGSSEHEEALRQLRLNDVGKNWEMYSNWANSVPLFPKVIKKKLRPLSELVKEVPCASLKRLNLRRAIEQYLSESDACHCQPCRNNGLAVLDGDQCRCICKPGTSGPACEQGAEEDGQQGVVDGHWACWSSWSSCSGGQQSRRRSCSNPAPQNGGQHCVGEATETSDCDDQELQNLRSVEPQCFDETLPAVPKCETPTALVNGYILDPKDIYPVGSTVEYTCNAGFYVIGNPIMTCSADLTWSGGPGVCTVWRCTLESLAEDVITDQLRLNFYMGDVVTLSCPPGKRLQGASEVSCYSGSFSPDPANIKCVPDTHH